MSKNSKKINYRLVQHRGESRIAIEFAYNLDWIERTKKQPDAKWSKTLKAWHIPDTEANRKMVNLPLKKIVAPAKMPNKPDLPQNNGFKQIATNYKGNEIHAVNIGILDELKQTLVISAYSAKTIKTYMGEVSIFLKYLGSKNAETVTPKDIKDYMQYCFEVQKLTENTLHSRLNALKFYYENVKGYKKFFWEIPRPKKHLQLPKVLNESELKRLFDAANNLKHKAILFVAYSAGLRVSEIVNLRLQDIDRERMQLFIYCSKGKKDRYVPLSVLVLDILEQYYIKESRKPKVYVFEGQTEGNQYTERSAQKIFADCKANAKISKTLSFHSLRHSFATHILEKGIDVVYIQELLGHFDIKTTKRYLHVRKEFLINIESPLDSLYRNKLGGKK